MMGNMVEANADEPRQDQLAVNNTTRARGEKNEAVFHNWSKFFQGGVWRTTINEQEHVHRYEMVSDGRFQFGETLDAGVRARIVIGVDPATGNCRIWQFGSDGCVTAFDLKQIDRDSWMLKGIGQGPKGNTSYRSKVTCTGPNSTREEMLEYVLNGVKQPTTVRTWNRTKE